MVAGPPTPLIVALVVSCTVIVWLAVVELPHASVAVQVRVTLNRLAQLPGVVTSWWVNVTIPQRSLAVGSLKTGVAGHSIVAGPPTPLIVGLVVSCTVMVWLAVVELPHASVAVQVRVTL